MKYSFIYLNAVDGYFTGAEHEINCAYIRSFLRKNQIETQQIIYKIYQRIPSVQALVNYICTKAMGSSLVMYVSEYNYRISSAALMMLRKRNFQSIILIGPSVSDIYNNLQKSFPAHCYVCGDSAYALLELSQYDSYPLIYATDNKVNIDQIPHPYSNGILPPLEVFNVGLYTSLGCYGKCCFCSYSQECKVQCFSIQSIRDELAYIYRKIGRVDGVISFLDDCFSGTSDRIVAICDIIETLHLPYKFWCTTRADLLSKDILVRLKSANFSLSVGMETASPQLLSSIGKLCTHTAEDYLQHIAMLCHFAQEINLPLTITVMFGLPNETPGDIATTLSFLGEHQISSVSYNFMTVFPNSRLFREYSELNRVSRASDTYSLRTYYAENMLPFVKKYVLENRYVKIQSELTSQMMELRKCTIEYISGIVPRFPRMSNAFEDSITLNLDSIKLTDELIERISFHTNIFVYCGKISKSSKMYTDDRKHLKFEFPEYEAIIAELAKAEIYCEKIFFLCEDGDKLKCKCGNYYESTLLTVPSITIDSPDIVDYVCNNYHNFMRCTDMTLNDILPFCFRGVHYFADRKPEAHPILSSFSQYMRIADVVEVSNFILKNSVVIGERFCIYCEETHPDFFGAHPLFKHCFLIFTLQMGFIYVPNLRISCRLNPYDSYLLQSAVSGSVSIEHYPRLYRLCLRFLNLVKNFD